MVLLEILHFLGKYLECDCPYIWLGKPYIGKVKLNYKEDRDPVFLKNPKT